jgi:hypothetical protein
VIACIAAAGAVLIAAAVGSGGNGTVLIFAAVTIPSLVALWLRVRAVWIGIIILLAINLLRVVALGAPVRAVAIVVGMLALLLAPPSRRFFRRDPSARRSHRLRRVLLWGVGVYGVLVVAGAVAWALLWVLANPVSGDLSLVHSNRPGVRVLFVGTTLTSDNEMPQMLAELAEGDPGAPVVFPVRYARRRSTLEKALDDRRLRDLLDDERWDYVVLQEHSQVADRAEDARTNMLPAAAALDGMAKQTHAKTVLFSSQGYREGDPAGEDDDAYYEMEQRIERGNRLVGSRVGATMAPVGHAWSLAILSDPRVALWKSDGRRPSVKGSYLTACVFYAQLIGRNPADSSFTAGLSPEWARWLASHARRAVSDKP